MNAQRVRVVVGEGRSSQQGLLRFVLDGEGYDVVADATNPAELARVLAAHKPDVVVLDDGIGATAVGMVREMVPGAKIVLVWPGDVVPIGGAAQVAPSRVLQELGPAVARVSGVAGVTAASAGAALVDEAKRDPDGLRRMIRNARAATTAAAAGAIIVDGASAPIVILPVTPQVDGVVTVPDADETAETPGEVATAGAVAAGAMAAGVMAAGVMAAGAGAPGAATAGAAGAATAAGGGGAAVGVVGARSDLNRRLGNLALGGAAVAGAIVLALALGGAKVPIAQVSGEAFTFTPPAAPVPGGASGDPGPPFEGDGNHGGQGNDHGAGSHSERSDFYPIQPYISSFLPESSLPPVAGGPVPSEDTRGRGSGNDQHHRRPGGAAHQAHAGDGTSGS